MATPGDEPLAPSGTQPLASDGQQDAVLEHPDRSEDANTTTADEKPDSPRQPPATTAAKPNNNDSPDNDDSDTDSSASDAEEARETTHAQSAPAVEWLATGREKRSTAGNRLKHMLAAQEPDDELELLFAEDGDDAAFSEADEDGSDLHMDSSSDDEDAQERGDDLEGEKELEKKAHENRQAARKRKAQEAIPLKFRKKVKIVAPPRSGSVTSSSAATPTMATTPGGRSAHAPRPKRKSERASWLPTAAEMPTRASRRETTMMSKEQLHQQMIEREVKRIKQVEAMERKAKKLEALRKPPKTQAERLAEAAMIEKKNAKSLNRWEEAEKQREEERRAKLAALNNRTLDGPVVTFWSGVGEWVDGKLKYVGKIVTIEEKPLKKKRGSGPDGDNTADGLVDDTVMPNVAGAHTDKQTTAEAITTDDGKQAALSSTTTTGEESVPVPIPADQPPPDQSRAMTAPQDMKTVQSIASVTEAPSDVASNREVPATLGTAPPITTTAQGGARNSGVSTTNVPVGDVPDPVPGTHSPPEAIQKQPQSASSAPPATVESAASGSSHPATTSIAPTPEAVKPPSTHAGTDVHSSSGTDLQPTADAVAPSHESLGLEPAVAAQDIEMTDVQHRPTPDTAQIESESTLPAQPPMPLNAQAQTPFPQPQAPGQASYTTMGFAPPPKLAMAVPQEGNLSTSSFLAPPTGVNSNGLSIPQIGHITTSSPSPHGLAPPILAAAPGSQAQLVSPGTALPQITQPHFRPVLSNVPVNVQSQPMKGHQQPTVAALPPKPRGGRQKKEKEKEASPPPPPRTPPPDGKATRNCFILQNFNENAIKEKSVQTRVLFGREMNKLAKPAPAPRCVITGQPARYKDPRTGLPYHNSFAYKEIQKLQKGEYKFSSLLGTWMGSGSMAAAGVPARFLDPSAPGPPPPPPPPPAEVVEQPPAGTEGAGNGDSGVAGDTVPAGGAPSSAPDPKANTAMLQQPPMVSTQAPLPTSASTPVPPVAAPTILNGPAMTPVATAKDVVPSPGSGSVLPGAAIDSTQGQMPQVQPSGLAGDTGPKSVVSHITAPPVVATEQALPQEGPVAQQ